MEVADAGFSAGDVHGQEDLTAIAQVLGVAGLTMFWASWDCSCSCFSCLGFDAMPPREFWGSGAKATMRSRLLAWIDPPSCTFHCARISLDGAHPRMPWDQACEAHTRNMMRVVEYAFKALDGIGQTSPRRLLPFFLSTTPMTPRGCSRSGCTS